MCCEIVSVIDYKIVPSQALSDARGPLLFRARRPDRTTAFQYVTSGGRILLRLVKALSDARGLLLFCARRLDRTTNFQPVTARGRLLLRLVIQC